MAGRIVVFGATGYTGRLTAEALVRRGERPVLAARSRERLAALARELEVERPLEVAVADVAKPATINALVERGDVLVATVGPFKRFGRPAVEAAAGAGAHYLDSTGEPPFIREVFEHYGPLAEHARCGLLTAFGYDFVPGNLAGALALREAGAAAVRVDTGYFFTGSAAGEASGGTRASLAGVLTAPAFAWRDGRLVTEPSARRVRDFSVNGKRRQAISVGASEHFGLPRFAPGLREVNAYLGWFGQLARPMQVASLGGSLVFKVPGARRLLDGATARLVKGSTGGPDAAQRAESGSHIVGIAYDAAGTQLAEVHLVGQNGYSYTGEILAWGAQRVAAGGLKETGALGPVDAFGLDELASGCAEAGLRQV